MSAGRALIIGGTRNLGPSIVGRFLDAGYSVTALNRGITAGELPGEVERLRADRTDLAQMRSVLAGRDFDAVIDTTLYNAAEAKDTVELLGGRVGRYVFISTGQVYLLRKELKRPYRESDYEGQVIEAPARARQFDYENWLYGADKRGAEDVLREAWEKSRFPFVTLRLPMVNSERDHFERIQGYTARLLDGGPVLLPEGEHLKLRHVYGEDVARATVAAASTPDIAGEAFNISQDDTLTIEEFLAIVGECLGCKPQIAKAGVDALEARGLYPDCSPFSEPWMSELDNELSKNVLGMTYTSYREYVPNLVEHYRAGGKVPAGYAKRQIELELARVTPGWMSSR